MRAAFLSSSLNRGDGSGSLRSTSVAAAVGTIATKLLNPELHDVTLVFYCLSASMLLVVCQSPLEAACHYLLRPQLVMFGWVPRVVCVGGLALMLAPGWGAWGAALAQLGGTVMAGMVFAACVFLALRAARKAEI
jgi:hypothetical protein